MLNPFQLRCAAAYAGGEFAYVESLEQVRSISDTLFTFLMVELSTHEDCTDQTEAIRRVEMAQANLQEVLDAFKASPCPASPS